VSAFAFVTTRDYHVVMKKVGIAELKARLSEYLRAVRAGETITVMDRDRPVAELGPHRSGPPPLRVRRPRGRYKSVHDVPLPPPLPYAVAEDAVQWLIEDRKRR
jgi:prevent-host-death family protein